MKKIIIVSISILSLISCKNKDDDPVPFENRVPEKLTFVAPEKGDMPSEAQLKEIQDTFSNKDKMILPPGELISPSDDMSPEKIQREEQELQKKDANSYRMLKEIQASCATPKPVVNSNFPKENENIKIKAGDIFSMDAKFNVTAKSSECPMTAKGELSGQYIVENWEQTETKLIRAGFSAGGSGKYEVLIKKPEYQKLLNARGMIIDTNISGLYSMIEPNQKMYMTGNLTGSYITLQKQIDYTTSLELVTKGPSSGSISQTQLIARAEMKFPSFKVSIVTHNISEGGKTLVSEVYLNGNKLDSYQQKKILNREAPGIGVIEQSKLLNALK